MSKKSLTVFFSYSHKDELLRDELAKHLKPLERDGTISTWYDRQIIAGTEWDNDIDANLNAADLILLLISADFLASDFCHQVELQRAIERHENGEARVIPIILRHCLWKKAVFSKLQVLPKNGEPVTKWADRDDAFTNIAEGIERAIDEMLKVAAVPVAPPQATVQNVTPIAAPTIKLPSAPIVSSPITTTPIQVKVRSGFNVSIPPKDVKKSAKNIEEGEIAFLTPEEYNLVAHQVDVIEPTVLLSAKGIDYRELEELLKAQEWRKADELTAKLMCQAANREKEGWLDTEHIEAFPCEDLQTIDQLWVHYSSSKFGFSIQKKLWLECGGAIGKYDYEVWKKFGKKFLL
jgi:hypothetical protein